MDLHQQMPSIFKTPGYVAGRGWDRPWSTRSRSPSSSSGWWSSEVWKHSRTLGRRVFGWSVRCWRFLKTSYSIHLSPYLSQFALMRSNTLAKCIGSGSDLITQSWHQADPSGSRRLLSGSRRLLNMSMAFLSICAAWQFKFNRTCKANGRIGFVSPEILCPKEKVFLRLQMMLGHLLIKSASETTRVELLRQFWSSMWRAFAPSITTCRTHGPQVASDLLWPKHLHTLSNMK